MRGSFNLSETGIKSVVSANSIGAYILSRGNNVAHYVGRSDANLRNRLRDHLEEGYIQFWFEETTSPLKAYYLECEWYHQYNPTDNENHPAVPPGATWKCPVTGCPWST